MAIERLKRIKAAFGFQFNWDRTVESGETVIIAMPQISADKRSVNDIGWQTDGSAVLYATICEVPETAMWEEVQQCQDINKTITYIKVVNNGSACRVVIRAILC